MGSASRNDLGTIAKLLGPPVTLMLTVAHVSLTWGYPPGNWGCPLILGATLQAPKVICELGHLCRKKGNFNYPPNTASLRLVLNSGV